MKFEIRLYESFRNLCFYTVHMEGELLCETDRFINRFKDDPTNSEDLAIIRRLIQNMGRFGSADNARFRFEDNAHALPDTPNKLRLYCIRCNSGTVVLCGGGRKTSQKVKDSPDAYPHFKIAKQVEELFRERIAASQFQDPEIRYNGKFLEGNLTFDTD